MAKKGSSMGMPCECKCGDKHTVRAPAYLMILSCLIPREGAKTTEEKAKTSEQLRKQIGYAAVGQLAFPISIAIEDGCVKRPWAGVPLFLSTPTAVEVLRTWKKRGWTYAKGQAMFKERKRRMINRSAK